VKALAVSHSSKAGDTSAAPAPGKPTPDPKPDLSIVPLIHRGEGWVSFSSKHTKEWPMFATAVDQIDNLPPGVMERLGRDAYFTLNTAGTPGKAKSKVAPGFPRGDRRASGLSHLNAVCADMDTYAAGIDRAEALAEVTRMQERGELPTVSLFMRSGRGLWCVWLLIDHATGKPPACTAGTLRLHKRIEQALIARLRHLGADPQSANPALHMRVPGSINSKSGEEVRYWVPLGADGKGFFYSLPDLAQRFNVGDTAAATQVQPAQPAVKVRRHTAQKPVDWQAVNERRLRNFRKLWSIRGGFDIGHRHNAAFIYATLLAQAGHDHATIVAEVTKLGQTCSPPMTAEEVTHATHRAGGYKHRTRTIVKLLDITPAEAAELEGWKAPAFRPRDFPTHTKDTATARRELMQQLVEQAGGELPPLRKMATLLSDKGHGVSKDTVAKDYKRLGWSG
jgi:hypothetical protein